MDAAASEPPDLIRKMAEYAGITESFRNYQNNVLFLVADGRPQRVEGSGPPAQAFQQVWDQCEEHSATALRRLQLSFYGSSKSHADSLAAVGLAIPQMGQADFGITLQLTIQFDPPPGEQFVLNFQGKWDRYKRFKQVTDAFAREEIHSLLVKFRLIVDFDRDALNDMQLKTIQDVLTQMGMGPVTLLAEPIYNAS
jgi:hypothetical protein